MVCGVNPQKETRDPLGGDLPFTFIGPETGRWTVGSLRSNKKDFRLDNVLAGPEAGRRALVPVSVPFSAFVAIYFANSKACLCLQAEFLSLFLLVCSRSSDNRPLWPSCFGSSLLAVSLCISSPSVSRVPGLFGQAKDLWWASPSLGRALFLAVLSADGPIRVEAHWCFSDIFNCLWFQILQRPFSEFALLSFRLGSSRLQTVYVFVFQSMSFTLPSLSIGNMGSHMTLWSTSKVSLFTCVLVTRLLPSKSLIYHIICKLFLLHLASILFFSSGCSLSPLLNSSSPQVQHVVSHTLLAIPSRWFLSYGVSIYMWMSRWWVSSVSSYFVYLSSTRCYCSCLIISSLILPSFGL